MGIVYNNDYKIKQVGYFHNYIYKYIDYEMNKSVLNLNLFKDQVLILYISNKSKEELNLTGILRFKNYNYIEFISLIDKEVTNYVKKFDILSIKERNKELHNLYVIIKI